MKLFFKTILAVALLLVLGTVGLVAATWQPDRSVEELSERWAPAPSQFIDVGGMKVHVRDEGEAGDSPPIVLLHGTSASLHTWDGWVDELAQHHRVVRFDLPGFGLTGPAKNDDYRLEAYVEFVVGVLNALGIERCVLGGNSLGGSIAWRTAVHHPDRVEKLILVDSGGFPYKPESVPIGFVLSQVPVVNQLMKVVLPRSAVESSVRNVYGDPEKVTPDLVDRYFELTLREGNRGALGKRFSQLQYQDQSALIQTIQQPTLILWGAQDKLIPPAIGVRFHENLPNSELVEFPGLGHVPHEEAPKITLAPVKPFLAVK